MDRKEYYKEYYKKNKETISNRTKLYLETHKDPEELGRRKNYSNQYSKNNRKKLNEYAKNYYREKVKIKDKSSIKKSEIELTKIRKKRNNYVNEKRNIDPIFKMSSNIRNLIRNAIKNQGYTKTSKTYRILGCSYKEFKIWIENKFVDGMSWNNYGEWEYDHIIPISSALNEEDLIKLNHYSNFQPLWKIDNIKKSNRIN